MRTVKDPYSSTAIAIIYTSSTTLRPIDLKNNSLLLISLHESGVYWWLSQATTIRSPNFIYGPTEPDDHKDFISSLVAITATMLATLVTSLCWKLLNFLLLSYKPRK